MRRRTSSGDDRRAYRRDAADARIGEAASAATIKWPARRSKPSGAACTRCRRGGQCSLRYRSSPPSWPAMSLRCGACDCREGSAISDGAIAARSTTRPPLEVDGRDRAPSPAAPSHVRLRRLLRHMGRAGRHALHRRGRGHARAGRPGYGFCDTPACGTISASASGRSRKRRAAG